MRETLFEKLRKLKPKITDPNAEIVPITSRGRQDPRFKGVTIQEPGRWITNTRNDMALQDLYSKGRLKSENTGRVCGECVNFYFDHVYGEYSGQKRVGRCKARGFMRVHEDTPADKTLGWTDPASGMWFKEWPACPYFVSRDRLSRK